MRVQFALTLIKLVSSEWSVPALVTHWKPLSLNVIPSQALLVLVSFSKDSFAAELRVFEAKNNHHSVPLFQTNYGIYPKMI